MRSYRENGFGLWALILKESRRFVGQCGISIQDIDSKKVPEIGYQINKAFWNRGYVTEMAGKCLEYGFDKLELEEIFIHTYVKNIPSIRVAEKLNMTRRKEYDKQVTPDKFMRHVVFSTMGKERYSS